MLYLLMLILATRDKLIDTMRRSLNEADKQFLLSLIN